MTLPPACMVTVLSSTSISFVRKSAPICEETQANRGQWFSQSGRRWPFPHAGNPGMRRFYHAGRKDLTVALYSLLNFFWTNLGGAGRQASRHKQGEESRGKPCASLV